MTKPVVLGGKSLRKHSPTHWPQYQESDVLAMMNVVTSGPAAGRAAVLAAETALAKLQKVRYARCVTNGTHAIEVALEALGIGAHDEVIVPGLTFPATAVAVLHVNARPVIADVNSDDYCMNPRSVEELIGPKTKAIIAVHLYESMADMHALLRLSKRYGLHLIEDCAHAHGAVYAGKGAGSLGDVGCFSFQSSKVITAGEGGCVVTNDAGLDERVRTLRDCGRRPEGSSEAWQPIVSGNYRITQWQAAVLVGALRRFPHQQKLRAASRAELDAAINKRPGFQPVRRRKEVTQPPEYAYVIRYNEEEFGGIPPMAIRIALSEEIGVQVTAPYEPLNSAMLYQTQTKRRLRISEEYWERIEPAHYNVPKAEKAHYEGIVIPHHALLDTTMPALLTKAIDRLNEHQTALARWARTRNGSGGIGQYPLCISQ